MTTAIFPFDNMQSKLVIESLHVHTEKEKKNIYTESKQTIPGANKSPLERKPHHSFIPLSCVSGIINKIWLASTIWQQNTIISTATNYTYVTIICQGLC